MGSGSSTSGRKIRGRQLEVSVIQLRQRGYTFAEIARACGCSASGAFGACKRALARLEELSEGEARELRRLQLARLDYALVKIWPQIEDGQLAAVDRLVKVLERQARLLGLDAPEPMRVVNHLDETIVAGVRRRDLEGMTMEERLERLNFALGISIRKEEPEDAPAGPPELEAANAGWPPLLPPGRGAR